MMRRRKPTAGGDWALRPTKQPPEIPHEPPSPKIRGSGQGSRRKRNSILPKSSEIEDEFGEDRPAASAVKNPSGSLEPSPISGKKNGSSH